MTIEEIVKLWHKTQMGNMHKCKENQAIFADIMWKLYNSIAEEHNNG